MKIRPVSPGPICLITGASSGIGFATALSMSYHAERIGLLCRSEERGVAACDAIRRANPAAGPIDLWIADLASLSEVRQVTHEIRSRYDRVDIVVNNAGAVFSRRELSADGLEMHFATNYAGHFLLTMLLIEEIARAPQPRIVTISSSLYRLGRLRLDDLAFSRPYHLVVAYAQSKLAGVLFSQELARRSLHVPILTTCVDPGFVRTGIYRGAIGHQRWLARRFEGFGRLPSEAAALIERVATEPQHATASCRYVTPNVERPLTTRACDPVMAGSLWWRSLEWLSPAEAIVVKNVVGG